MSGLNDLIQQLCPKGVVHRKLGELEDSGLIKLGRGDVISKNDLAKHPGDFPVYSSSASGRGEFGRYGKYMFEDERITWSVDGGGKFFYREPHKYSVTNVAGWIKVLNEQQISCRYLYFVLSSVWATRKYDYIVKAHPSVIREDYVIPIPPIEVQKEIVSILDKFTQLEAELEAELEARRVQYEVTRDRLLDFSSDSRPHPLGSMIRELCPEGVKHKTLSELLGTIPRGKRLTKSALPEGGLIPVFHGGLEPIGFTDQANTAAMTVMVINVGASAGTVGWSEKPFWCSDGCYAMPHSDSIVPKYLYYCALNNQGLLIERVRKAGIPTLAASSVLALKIPVPPLQIQKEIVSILDKLDALSNDITIGLPAEISVRRRQYEYYRNKLLTFKELNAA